MKVLTKLEASSLIGGDFSKARCARIARRRDRNLYRNWDRYTRLRDRYDRNCP